MDESFESVIIQRDWMVDGWTEGKIGGLWMNG